MEQRDKLRGASEYSMSLRLTSSLDSKFEKTDKLKGIADSSMGHQPTMNDVLAGIEPQELTWPTIFGDQLSALRRMMFATRNVILDQERNRRTSLKSRINIPSLPRAHRGLEGRPIHSAKVVMQARIPRNQERTNGMALHSTLVMALMMMQPSQVVSSCFKTLGVCRGLLWIVYHPVGYGQRVLDYQRFHPC